MGGGVGEVTVSWGEMHDLSLPCEFGLGRALMENGPVSLTGPPAPSISSPPSPFGMPHLDYPSSSSLGATVGDQTTTNHQLFTADAPSQDISGSRQAKRLNHSRHDDGHKWRKYGEKQYKGRKGSKSHDEGNPIKENEASRGYYMCTHQNCPVRKHVQRSITGCITQITYKGQHNHALAALLGQLHEPKDSEYSVDTYMRFEENEEDEACAEGSSTGAATSEGAESSETATGPKVVVQTRSEVLLMDDGYRWRKYGQKVVKGNHNPRSYYRCTSIGCDVRKKVERSATEPEDVITTYDGKHNHNAQRSCM